MSENPKEHAALRDAKPPLDLLEFPAMAEIAWAMKNGADKYGKANYQTIPISARVYAAACIRHLLQFLDGEDVAEDSGLHHFAHVGANVNIFFKALADGNLVDDRGPEGQTDDQRMRSDISNRVEPDSWGPLPVVVDEWVPKGFVVTLNGVEFRGP